MKFPRASGILLHPTSLPGRYGIGDLGPQAFRFIEFLHDAGQKLWQVLPLGPTGDGDSPYQLFSAFAGNPLLISPEGLVARGWLQPSDIAHPPVFPDGRMDSALVRRWKFPLLDRAFSNFRPDAYYRAFLEDNAGWLDDFALFLALKDEHGGKPWTEWEREAASREPAALARWRKCLAREIGVIKFRQFAFFEQWQDLKDRCRRLGIRIMGDIPIYVSHDSADVWAHPDLFELDADGRPAFVSGVPPDYFSETGQLWNNPTYNWPAMEKAGWRWWIDRFHFTLRTVDIARLDHFRGFEAYWRVPAAEETAVNGKWVKAPGDKLFSACQAALGELPFVAENLGVITDDVEGMRRRFGFPGMSVLQFAFGTDPQAASFQPHNYEREVAAYTGTHDNDTTLGWWNGSGNGDPRSPEQISRERENAARYLDLGGREVNWAFIHAVMSSVADTAIVPVQDAAGLGSEARMNVPGSATGNWTWRLTEGQLTPEIARRLREMSETYGRAKAR